MKTRAGLIGLALTGALVLAGCDLTRTRVLVWHDWPEPEAEVLVELLDAYSELDPDLRLIVEYVPAEELETRFADETRSGFGPDVLIGVDAGRLADLVAEDAVHLISTGQVDRYGFDDLEARAVQAMEIDDRRFGVPLAGFTNVLYYREGIDPPLTLDDIVALAEDGYTTGIPVDLFRSYWGVDAFAGSVFGEEETLDPDRGFVDWMEWLVEARPHPNIILDADYDTLRDLFAEGRLDLFIGDSSELGTFRTELLEASRATGAGTGESPSGPEVSLVGDPTDVTFGLATLPGEENDAPGGFLDVEGMVVNRHTDNLDESLALLAYLTNVPSQGRIARSGVGRIPINDAVSIDPTISPLEAALVRQQRRSVVLPRTFQDHQTELSTIGNEVLLQVTRGLVEPAAAADLLRDRYLETRDAGDG
ncbi:MAG: extracellular solute-binding protein [Acidimicrobiales bacterium]